MVNGFKLIPGISRKRRIQNVSDNPVRSLKDPCDMYFGSRPFGCNVIPKDHTFRFSYPRIFWMEIWKSDLTLKEAQYSRRLSLNCSMDRDLQGVLISVS